MTPETRDGFKQLGEHIEGCAACGNRSGSPWVIHDRDRPADYRRKRNGDRGGSTMWHRFVCNDLRCKAVLLVRWDTLSRFLNGDPEAVSD